jgi:hypothetical protein
MNIKMNCTCGVPAFFYETIKSDKMKYSVYKCGTLYSESKRGKCEFILETALNKITLTSPSRDVNQPEISLKKTLDSKTEIYENLKNYIYLLEISKNNYGLSKNNYISNINFILKKLNLPLFFPNREFLTSLKFRIYDIPRKKNTKNTLYPITIIEIPDNLKTQNKKYIRKSKTVLIKNYNKLGGIPRIVLNPDDILSSIKKLEIKSDSENDSESENAEDNFFDIDNSDSEIEDNYCDDGGGISD